MKRILKSLAFILGVLMLPTVAYAQNIYADVNGDLEVNIADINAVIGVILSDVSNPSADVNGDGEVNIADINAVIDIILGGGIDPHLLEVCEKVSDIDQVIASFYKQCASIDELKEHTAEIEAIEGVEYVFFDEVTMFTKIEDFGTISYSYYPKDDVIITDRMMQNALKQLESRGNIQTIQNQGINETNVLIVNQQFKDENRQDYVLCYNELKDIFLFAGFVNTKIENSPSVDFYRNSLYDNDYVFLITHGCYEYDVIENYLNPGQYQGTHWLMTSDEVPRVEVALGLTTKIDKNRLAELMKGYDTKDVSFGTVTEKRNGKDIAVSYLKVSEHFINSSEKQFKHPGKAIVFNTACQSMKGPHSNTIDSINNSLARAFQLKGTGTYLGYDQTNTVGKPGGIAFFGRLLSGMTIEGALNDLQFELRHEDKTELFGLLGYWTDLEMLSTPEFNQTRIIKPLISYEDLSNDNNIRIDLHANSILAYYSMKGIEFSAVLDENDYNTLPFSYGIELSESGIFTEGSRLGEKRLGDDGCTWDANTTLIDYSESLTYNNIEEDSKVKPNTTYWARAYVYDGQGYNYSDPISFTTGSIGGENPQTETFTVNGVSFKMVAIEGGTFMMGAADDDTEANADERPAHQVTLSNYKIGETEVTQALWVAVMGYNPSYFQGDLNRPVECVTWDNCQTFITKLNEMTGKAFCLPTEAEWEFASRGGKCSHGYKYSGSNVINDVAWYGDNSGSQTHSVAGKSPNELGLYDMSGNIWEWCRDWYDNNYYSNSSSLNPTGPNSGPIHVLRGGAWNDPAISCRVSHRDGNIYGLSQNRGFRLAMSIEPELQHEYVDLGLPSGTLWATCNVGANSPEEYGDYFAWGETEPKEVYSWESYKWCNGSNNTLTKYNTNSSYGMVDNKTELEPEDDAAYVNWGPSWRMPTDDQLLELRKKCTWELTTRNGVSGRLVTGPNGNSLFLPAAGYFFNDWLDGVGFRGYFWPCTLYSDAPDSAYFVGFNTTGYTHFYNERCYGFTVRAVRVP